MIGVLMNRKPLRAIINDNTSYERLEFYRYFVETYRESLCFYSLNHVDPCKNNMNGFVLSPGESLIQTKVKIPKYHFCRGIFHRKKNLDKLRDFIRSHQINFYQLQSKKERNKWTHYCILRDVPEIKPHLPDTRLLTWDGLVDMLDEYKQVVVKPIHGWLGKNIVLFEKNHHVYMIKEKVGGNIIRSEVAFEHLKMYYLSKFKRSRQYIVQQKINSTMIHRRIYDCRVSVQKTVSNEWKVTGWAVRLAQKDDYLTNVAQGSGTIPFSKLFSKSGKVALAICNLTTQIAKQFEKHFPGLIDLGIDLMLDKNKHVWFVEANLRDQRLSYQKLNDIETWRRTTITPLIYIKSQMVSKSELTDG